jgi:hypothetical protein
MTNQIQDRVEKGQEWSTCMEKIIKHPENSETKPDTI